MDLTVLVNRPTSAESSPEDDQDSFVDERGLVPLDAIIPLIEEEWGDSERALYEQYDAQNTKLLAKSARLRNQLHNCTDGLLYQRIEAELSDVEEQLCHTLV